MDDKTWTNRIEPPLDYADLYDRARSNLFSKQEIMAIVQLLEQTGDTGLIKTIGYLGLRSSEEYTVVLEPFLRGPDSRAAFWALYVVCEYWHLTSRYVDTLLRFMRRPDWDVHRTCQELSMDIAVQYLRSHDEPRLLSEFINILQGPTEQNDTRNLAYVFILHFFGYADETSMPVDSLVQLLTNRLNEHA